jgi:epoxyqueuosine reductase
MQMDQSNSDLKDLIKKKALNLGFDAINFTTSVELTDESRFFSQWLNEGKNGDMKWMERDQDIRFNPAGLLPGTKTVIVLAKSYLNEFNHTEETGKISRYAWGRDYHDVIKPKLTALGDYITELRPENKYAVSVDSGRVFEKAWAVKAGLGWQGKHSLIINRVLGSFFFIGIIYSSIEIPPDKSIDDKCGTCRKCINACPTGAIGENRSIDARLCLSYWLNEASRNGEIPDTIRLLNKNWIYGCDACQDVCPINKTADRKTEPNFFPNKYGTNLKPEDVLKMDEAEFKEKFAGSSIYRLKLRGLQNNC